MAKHLGKTVAKNSDFTFKELRQYIGVKNIEYMIKEHSRYKHGRYEINDNGVEAVMSDIFEWLMGRDLARLAAEDKIDSYWSDEEDCMVFKIKNGDNDEQNTI